MQSYQAPQIGQTLWSNSWLQANYISASSFSVSGNYTATFTSSTPIRLNVNGVMKYTYVQSSSFGSGITTIVIPSGDSNYDVSLTNVVLSIDVSMITTEYLNSSYLAVGIPLVFQNLTLLGSRGLSVASNVSASGFYISGNSVVTSFNGRHGAVLPAANDYALAGLSDVNLNSPASGNILQYSGTFWENVVPPSAPVTSVFGRQGAVVAQEPDYSEWYGELNNTNTWLDNATFNASIISSNPNTYTFTTTAVTIGYNNTAQLVTQTNGPWVTSNFSVKYGTDGSYGVNTGTGTAWAATIWSIGPSYDGGAAGSGYSATSLYGLCWLRGNISGGPQATYGEGLYVYQNGTLYGAIGTSGGYVNGPFTCSALSATTGTFSGALSATTGTFSGALSATTGNFTSSSLRWKTNIEPLELNIDSFMELDPCTFDITREGVDDKYKHSVGFIAEKMVNIYPKIVTVDEVGPAGIDYGRISPYHVKVTQNHEERIRELEHQLLLLSGK